MYTFGRKDPEQKQFDLPYLAIDDAIEEVIKRSQTEWHSALDLATRTSKPTEKKKKDMTK